MSPDLINGLFELCGAAFIALHIRQIRRDKKVAGVSIPAIIFFTSWGFWNLFYYPHLEQWLSFTGGLAIVVTNMVWVGYLLYYSRNPQGETEMYFDEYDWSDK